MKRTTIPYCDNVVRDRVGNYGVEVVAIDGAAIAHIADAGAELQNEMGNPCRFDAVVVLCCVKGEVSFSSQMSDVTVKAGEIYVNTISMMQFNSIADSEFYLMAFKSAFLTEIKPDVRCLANMLSLLHSGINMVRCGADKLRRLGILFGLMVEESKEPHEGDYLELSMRHLFSSILYRIFNDITRVKGEASIRTIGVKDRSSEYLERLMRLIAENYREQRNVEFYAEKMNITPKHLSRVVRGVSGKSVHQWIDEFVALEIKNLLKYSDMSIQQISYALNFPNPSFMGQYFKRITGMTPGEYKRS